MMVQICKVWSFLILSLGFIFAENCLNMQYLSNPQPLQLEFNLALYRKPPNSPNKNQFENSFISTFI